MNFLLSPSWIARSNYIKSNIEHFGLLRVSKIVRKLNQRVLFHILTSSVNVSFIGIGCLVAVSHPEKQSAILIHEKPFFHHVPFLWINQTASWRSKRRKIFTLGNFFLAIWELRDQKSSFKIIANRRNTLWGQGPASLEHVYSAFNLITLQYTHEEVNS